MAFNTQEQEIIKFGAANGKSRAEVEQAISNFRSGVVPKKVEVKPQEISIADGLSRVATTYGQNLKDQALGGVENAQKTFIQGVDTMQQAQQIPLDTNANKDKAILTGAAGAGQIGVGAMSGLIQTAFSPITAAVLTGIQGYKELDQATGGKMQNQIQQVAQSNPELIRSISDYVVQNPKKVQFASDMLNVLTSGAGAKVASEATKDLTKSVTTGIKEMGTPKSIDGIPVSTMADEALHSGLQLKNDIQLSIAKKNVSPQLESSAGRLMSDTAQNVENPVVAYDKYLEQSKKSLGDIKVDAPISTVGSKIGDAFMKVVAQKRAVGTTLGNELKNVGKLKVSVVEPKGTLLSELKDSGLSYNPRTNELTSFQGSKFAPEEVSMLNQYVKDLQALGDSPSVSQIDNFISKTRSDLNFAKGKSGVTGTTNAERIIKGNLAGMRESLNPEKNGLSQLSTYWKANKAYSELSDFVDEGAGFLGKTTQSGDFAKDASVAKSSVQSILNGGKKDWLIKLEGLTGYPALDESVLALQAMKDAGDFKGLSLLQAMQESGGIPTTKAGFTQKILDMAISRGEKLIVGTPEEQTRALLQDLSNKAKTASTPKTSTIAKPTGGQSTQSIKSSNVSDIPPKSTPTTPKSKGIRGMINLNPTTWFEEVGNSADVGLKAKTAKLQLEMAQEAARTMRNNGISVEVPTSKNAVQILKQARDVATKNRVSDIVKSETPSDKMNPFLEPKKKAVSDSVTIYKGLSKEASNNPLGSFTTDINHAKRWTKGGGVVVERTFKPDTKFTPFQEYHDKFMELKTETATDAYFKAKGYDGVDFRNSPTMKGVTEKEIRIWNPEKLTKVVNSLEQEAKKYKNAEEFVKAQGEILYHGSPVGIIDKIDKTKLKPNGELGSGFYLSEDSKIASYYAKESGKVNEINIGNLRLLNTSKSGVDGFVDNVIKYGRENYIQKLKDEGYDGIRAMDKKEVVIFPESVDKLKTKSELTNIWHKVNKKLDENMSKIKLEQTASMLKDEAIATKKKVVSSLEQEANTKAIKNYTKDGGQKINSLIRSGKAFDNELVKNIDSYIANGKKYNGTSYRGLTLSDSEYDNFVSSVKKNGYSDKGYISSSENFGDSTSFARTSPSNKTKGVILQIESGNGTLIDKKLNKFNEEEILHPRNSKFKYVDEYMKDGKKVIIVK